VRSTRTVPHGPAVTRSSARGGQWTPTWGMLLLSGSSWSVGPGCSPLGPLRALLCARGRCGSRVTAAGGDGRVQLEPLKGTVTESDGRSLTEWQARAASGQWHAPDPSRAPPARDSAPLRGPPIWPMRQPRASASGLAASGTRGRCRPGPPQRRHSGTTRALSGPASGPLAGCAAGHPQAASGVACGISPTRPRL
jgi:hypothetical protein